LPTPRHEDRKVSRRDAQDSERLPSEAAGSIASLASSKYEVTYDKRGVVRLLRLATGKGDEMSQDTRHGSLVRAMTIVSMGVLASAGVALAAQPKKGASYSGAFKSLSSDTVSFKVSANGKKVSGFAIPNPPVGCQGGAFGSASGGTATVSTQGTFKITLNLVFAPEHRTNGKVVVSGRFGKHGTESGKISSVFTSKTFSTSCNASVTYSTKD
jgi:hypothetical protein